MNSMIDLREPISNGSMRIGLDGMRTVNLDELNRAMLHDRVESKVILRDSAIPQTLLALASDYYVFALGSSRSQNYRTEYFDDGRLRNYHEHHNQIRRRVKVRYRRYLDSDITFFEIKQNLDGRTVKTRRQSEGPRNGQIGPEDALLLYEATGRNAKQLFPSLTVDYERILLVRNDFKERVTIDLGVRFLSAGSAVEARHLAICEFKQESYDRHSPAMVALNRRPQMFSKYCMGLASCNPDLRRNRFKKVFRQLEAIDVSTDLESSE